MRQPSQPSQPPQPTPAPPSLRRLRHLESRGRRPPADSAQVLNGVSVTSDGLIIHGAEAVLSDSHWSSYASHPTLSPPIPNRALVIDCNTIPYLPYGLASHRSQPPRSFSLVLAPFPLTSSAHPLRTSLIGRAGTDEAITRTNCVAPRPLWPLDGAPATTAARRRSPSRRSSSRRPTSRRS